MTGPVLLAVALLAAAGPPPAAVTPVERTDPTSRRHTSRCSRRPVPAASTCTSPETRSRAGGGATDYPDFLAHWDQTFRGWNAADFGWGGDTARYR